MLKINEKLMRSLTKENSDSILSAKEFIEQQINSIITTELEKIGDIVNQVTTGVPKIAFVHHTVEWNDGEECIPRYGWVTGHLQSEYPMGEQMIEGIPEATEVFFGKRVYIDDIHEEMLDGKREEIIYRTEEDLKNYRNDTTLINVTSSILKIVGNYLGPCFIIVFDNLGEYNKPTVQIIKYKAGY